MENIFGILGLINIFSSEELSVKIMDTINASQYQHIFINVLDRLVDFYITLYVARKSDHEVVSVLTAIRNGTESYLVDSGFTQQDLIDINAVDEALDIFQVNYSYSRPISKKLINVNPRLDAINKRFARYMYEINSGNSVELVEDELIIHKLQSEQQSIMKNFISSLKESHPCLHLIRIVDIVNAPKIEKLIPLINNVIQSWKELDHIGNDNKKHDNECIVEAAIDNIIKLAAFYPERLYPGLRYAFPQYEGAENYDSLAISFSHKTSTKDMQSALNDINFQFEKFKIYYHNHEINFIDDIRLERLKPFISKPVRDNEYIKQLNSIEGTFHALFAWERCHLDGLSKADAINETHLLLNESRDLTIPAEDYKRKVRERFKSIEGYIKDKASYIHTLT
jgi:hypothetical protein